MPSVDDTLAQLSGATVFSKVDANSGFWQIPLAEGVLPPHHIHHSSRSILFQEASFRDFQCTGIISKENESDSGWPQGSYLPHR